MRILPASPKLATVRYEIRGPVLDAAKALEAQGERVLKLNIGNPAPFGFEAPSYLVEDTIEGLRRGVGYSDSKGHLPAREAIAAYADTKGLSRVDPERVYIGNGASELIVSTLQALLDNGDEVLVPAPDYPLWTGAVAFAGGRPVHYLCDETAEWAPDLDDMAAKITPRTRAVVVINPNNPTGAVYSEDVLRGVLDLARRHDLVVMSDEIYDKILYDGTEHTSTAALAPDLLCVTFNGLSKAYRACGYRVGWAVVSGPTDHAQGYLAALDLLANMRLGSTHPPQFGIVRALRDGVEDVQALCRPGGRFCDQRDITHDMLTRIEGVEVVKPRGSLYTFPRLDPRIYPIQDDEQFVLRLLQEEKILVVHGSGFNWPRPDHFRIVNLPRVEDLQEALTRIGGFLARYRDDAVAGRL